MKPFGNLCFIVALTVPTTYVQGVFHHIDQRCLVMKRRGEELNTGSQACGVKHSGKKEHVKGIQEPWVYPIGAGMNLGFK